MSTLDQLRQGLERAFETLMEGWEEFRARAAQALTRFTPKEGEIVLEGGKQASKWGFLAAEVAEDDNHVYVRLEAPGMSRDDFDIEIRGDFLVIRGEKAYRREESKGVYQLSECAYGSFERAITLPCAVQEEGASAVYRKGVLEITLPKAASSTGKKVPITQEEE
jgi:HSP20 family protein